MEQALFGISNSRVVPPANSGPPKGPAGFRVSATRHGVIGINCSGVGDGADALLVMVMLLGVKKPDASFVGCNEPLDGLTVSKEKELWVFAPLGSTCGRV